MKTALTPSLLAVLLLAGCGRPSPAGDANGQPPLPVRVAIVRAEVLRQTVETAGTVRALRLARISAKVMGSITDLPVTLGERVKAGQLIARIDAEEITSRVAEARAGLDAAHRDLERERALLIKGASTAETVRALQDRFAAAQAQLRGAEAMAGYTLIRAPFDGRVARTFAETGDLASPGLPLVDLESDGPLEVDAPLPESLAAGLATGAQLPIVLPTEGIRFVGSIVELSSAADPQARTVEAKIRIPDGIAARSGEYARVDLEGPPATALFAPTSAISAVGQMECVFVALPDGRAGLRLVRTGAARGDRTEILSGLDDGERVVVSPPPGLREGRSLEAIP